MEEVRLDPNVNKPKLVLYTPNLHEPVEIPLIDGRAACGYTGFPSPAEDYLGTSMDINQYLNIKTNTTFYVKVVGSSMEGVGISEDDVLVVDTSMEPNNGDIAVCALDGELVVKTIEKRGHDFFLISANPQFKPIQLTEGNELQIFGIVTGIVKKLKKR